MPEVSGFRRVFDIWNEVPLVPQTTGMSCWAAAAAMIIGWRDSVDVDPEEVASGAGRWSAFRDGLHPGDVDALARAWELVAEPDRAWTVDSLAKCLARNGPIWMGEASPGLHSIVIVGMRGDGSPHGTQVRINDPWPVGRGERYTLTWRELTDNYRAASDLLGVGAHVLHAGGRRGASRWRVRETHWARSDYSIPATPTAEAAMHTTNGSARRRLRHHEDYPQSYGSPAAVAATVIAAGEMYVDTSGDPHDPLRGHGGTGKNLYLAWNELPDDLSRIDVVVHFHGYLGRDPDTRMLETVVHKAGLVLRGRTRPTLAILPRGRKISPAELEAARRRFEAHETRFPPRADRYTHDAIMGADGAGLERLVNYSLDWLAANLLHRSGAPGIDRMILSCHSGGGASLENVLGRRSRRVTNPDELHIFDALYGGITNIQAWATDHLRADRAASTPSSALRVFYLTTPTQSRALGSVLPGASDPLHARYRVEASSQTHDDIPRLFEPVLLQNVAADVVLDPPRAPARSHGLEWAASLGLDDQARAFFTASGNARSALAADALSWVRGTDHSAIELLPDAGQRRHFLEEVNWSRQDFSGRGPNTRESEALFAAIATIVTERRVPQGIRYHEVEHEVRVVPDTGGRKLYPEAADAFVALRAAAQADGVSLRIQSAWRSRAQQQQIAANNPNPAAVAQGISAHNYGLAVDLALSVPGLSIAEASTASMPNMVAMYRSPVYKWLALHGREHGWFPYRREPWHWEYNPPGFKERFEGGATAQAHSYYGAPYGLFQAYQSPVAAPPDYARESAGYALQAPPIDWCQKRIDIARIARAEEARWTFPNGTKALESNPAFLNVLRDYWLTVPGFTTNAAALAQAQQSAADVVGAEWSAAFICFVMNRAGIRRQDGFEFSQRHMNYIVGALRNRERSDHDKPFWLVDHVELLHEATPEPGDLICFNRIANGVMTHHSYTSLRREFWENGHENDPVTGSSHCALVVGSGQNPDGTHFVETIGGNETHSVRIRHVPVDANGNIANPAALNVFGMIKLVGC